MGSPGREVGRRANYPSRRIPAITSAPPQSGQSPPDRWSKSLPTPGNHVPRYERYALYSGFSESWLRLSRVGRRPYRGATALATSQNVEGKCAPQQVSPGIVARPHVTPRRTRAPRFIVAGLADGPACRCSRFSWCRCHGRRRRRIRMARALYRNINDLGDDHFVLRDPAARYDALSAPKSAALSA